MPVMNKTSKQNSPLTFEDPAKELFYSNYKPFCEVRINKF